jgi:hypothetical protein
MSAPLLDSLHVPRRFHAGPHETRENGRGDGGARPHEWVFPGAPRIPGPPVRAASTDRCSTTS